MHSVSLWDELNQDQWSNITQILVHLKNQKIFAQSGFIIFFDAPWSEQSSISDSNLALFKGM